MRATSFISIVGAHEMILGGTAQEHAFEEWSAKAGFQSESRFFALTTIGLRLGQKAQTPATESQWPFDSVVLSSVTSNCISRGPRPRSTARGPILLHRDLGPRPPTDQYSTRIVGP